MTEEQMVKCIECFNIGTVRLMLSPINMTVGHFLEKFQEDMKEKYGKCTLEDIEFAEDLLEHWQNVNQ